MKKILILGTSSFGGSATAKFFLDKNYFVIGTFRNSKDYFYQPHLWSKNIKNFKNFKIDFDLNKDILKLLKIIRFYKPKFIIDFASICMVNESWDNPNKYIRINLEKKSFIIKKIINYSFLKKYIYISTPEIFGSNDKSIKEDHNIYNPSTPYAISKLAFEMLLKSYGDQYNFPYIICRFSNFFGVGQPNFRLISKVFLNIYLKKNFYIDGKGDTKRSFIDGYDFANGLFCVIKNGKPKENYHFSAKKLITIKKVVQLICKLKSIKFKNFIKYKKERRGKDQVYLLNCDKTKKDLNWNAKINFITTLKSIDKFYYANLNKLKKLDSEYKER